jgi:hypothetical protein
MSNIFSKYEKELAGVQVIDSRSAYVYNKKTKKNDQLNPNYDFVGKVDTDMPNFILKMNKKGCKTSFIEDTSVLPKRVKCDLVNHFYNKDGSRNSRTKAYLVRTDSKSKTSKSLFSSKNSKKY